MSAGFAHERAGRVTVGLLHPGEMGAAVGAALTAVGCRVVWPSAGRSRATVERASAAGLEDLGEVPAVCGASDLILSIVPPAEAVAVAASLEGSGFGGIYVDANAISPETARTVALTVERGGARCVDGGIIGRPPSSFGDVRLYLSGPEAATVLELFAGTVVDARFAGASIGAASAVKVAYAGWTKGSMALLLTMREYAGREGVADILLDEWEISLPQLEARWAAAVAAAEQKGWRWVGEMQQIASSLSSVGLPPGFHTAAGDVFAAPESA